MQKDLGHKPVKRLRTRTGCRKYVYMNNLYCNVKAQQFLKLISTNRHVVTISSK